MNPQEFQKKLAALLYEAASPADEKDALPLFAVIGVLECTKSDLMRRSAMQYEQMAAMKFAEEMASKTPAPAPDKTKEN